MANEPTTTTADAPQATRRRPRRGATGRFLRRTTLRRAIVEAVAIFVAGRLLGMVPAAFWPVALFPLILIARLVLSFSPPVWAALRVVSTRREKMSRRFWHLGWRLAALCTLADALVALVLGEATLFPRPPAPPPLPPLRPAAHPPLLP